MNLTHFVEAQDRIWPAPLDEIRSGHKRTHWAWFVLPQIKGLGRSRFAKTFAIETLDHARDYMAHPVLGSRLIETCAAMLTLENTTATRVLGPIDALKLQSCATLFETATGDDIFVHILTRYFGDQRCETTLDYVAGRKSLPSDDQYLP